MHCGATDWMVSGPHSPARPLTEDRSCLFQRCHLLFTLLVLFCHLDDLLVASATFCQHPILDICHRQSKDFLGDRHWTVVYCSPSTFGLFLLRPLLSITICHCQELSRPAFCKFWVKTPSVILLWYCWNFRHEVRFPPKMTKVINFDAFTLLSKNSRQIHLLMCEFFLPENPVVFIFWQISFLPYAYA